MRNDVSSTMFSAESCQGPPVGISVICPPFGVFTVFTCSQSGPFSVGDRMGGADRSMEVGMPCHR